MKDFNSIKYFVLDVDGTMTDSGLYYDNQGNEYKRFSSRDGEAIKLARSLGIKIIVITGRCCVANTRRAQELHVDVCDQGVQDKHNYLKELMTKEGIEKQEIAYIGDDINDLKAMSLVGFIGCPADSCEEVLSLADYVAKKNGGDGAVRDAIGYVLKRRGEWQSAIKKVYDVEIESIMKAKESQ